MVLHQVAIRHKNGLIVGMVEWRNRPMTARQTIQLYDKLKRDHVVWRLENGTSVESYNPQTQKPIAWAGVVNHFVDATEFIKEFDY